MKLPHVKHAVDKAREQVSDQLQPGEEFLAAVPLRPIGDYASTAMSIGGINQTPALPGLDIAINQAVYKHTTRHDADNVADIPRADVSFGSHGAIIVAATDRRFLIFDRTLTGKPTDLLHEWPVAGITAEARSHQLLSGETVESLRLVLPNHTLLAGEFDAHLNGKDAQQLLEVLERAA